MRLEMTVTAITSALLVPVLLLLPLHAQQAPPPVAAAWWRLTTALSNDEMQGRDTGSEAYERAARFVADSFKASGLQPAGDPGPDGKPTFFQRVPMHQLDLDTAHSSVDLLTPGGQTDPLKLLYEVTLTPREKLRSVSEGQIIFVGYGIPTPTTPDLHGKVAVYFSNSPADLSSEQRQNFITVRSRLLAKSGAAAIISIDNPSAIEPTHWPAAYARTVMLPREFIVDYITGSPSLRISAEAASKLFAGTSTDTAKLFADAERGLPLPTLTLPSSLRIHLTFTEKDISSPNILAVLPGSAATDTNDPALAPEYVALSAHLDGYGFGTPVLGDSLYNGTLDDAAYVALLLDLAHQLHSAPPKRSLLFCIFTGEEKGLLGSAYFTQHPTVPIPQIVADLNLDQLRPIFPLTILTMEGLDDSTLGATARQVASAFHIELRPDRETERNLYRRADNYNFVRVGVPIASFIFGYNPGSPEERIYRDWYARRYHKPQDDLATPIDWQAAVRFNTFYRDLTLAVANAANRPAWLPGSPNAPAARSGLAP